MKTAKAFTTSISSFYEGVDRHPEGCGFKLIDHLTHNVYRGRMDYWANFYERLFNFREIRYFDIKGEYTGLLSKAMTAPDGKIRIPLNEEATQGSGQIEEFLMQYNGEGIQHIALICDDLLACWDQLEGTGHAVHDRRRRRPTTRCSKSACRVTANRWTSCRRAAFCWTAPPRTATRGLLLQIFSQTMIGPVFFEFIQRKKDEGFGEGNFKALFESMERDQIRRGVLKE